MEVKVNQEDENQLISLTLEGLNTDLESLPIEQRIFVEILIENGGSMRQGDLMREWNLRNVQRMLAIMVEDGEVIDHGDGTYSLAYESSQDD